MKNQNNPKKSKDVDPKVKTPTPPQVMDPSKSPKKQDGKKSGKTDKELAPNEEL